MDEEKFVSRRDFLVRVALLASGSFLIDEQALAAITPAKAYKRGTLLGIVPFINERAVEPGKLFASGLDARMYADLSSMSAETLITPAEQFYVRTACPDQINYQSPWKIKITTRDLEAREVPVETLLSMETDMGIHLMECAGNERNGQFGLMSACGWRGVRVTELLESLKLNVDPKRVCIAGFDGHSQPSLGIGVRKSVPGASWIFTLEQLASTGAFLATKMNGAPLSKDHGFPVRLLVPGWYGCTCIKWVDEISMVDDNAPATSQMKEFADRTHQDGVPLLAREYKSASIDQAAMPIRVEHWNVGDKDKYNVVGIMWGGEKLAKGLQIRFRPDEAFMPVKSYHQTTNRTWTLWSHRWTPREAGAYRIQLRIDDPAISSKRLDQGYYARSVEIRQI